MMLSLVLLISLFAGYESLLDEGHPQIVADSDLVKGRLDKTKIVPPLAKKSQLILDVEYDSTSTADKCQLDIDFEMSDPSKLSDNQLFQARFIIRPENNYLTLVQSSKVDGKWKKWDETGVKGMESRKYQLHIDVGAEFFKVILVASEVTKFPTKVSTDLISGFTAIKISNSSCFRRIPDSIEIFHEEAIEDCEGGQLWFTGISDKRGSDGVNCKPGRCGGKYAEKCPGEKKNVCGRAGSDDQCRSGCACPKDKPVMISGICSTMDACAKIIINGGWSDWSRYWSSCSKYCGSGEETKTRTCTNPKPANGGSECVGGDTIIRSCNTHVCPDATQIAKERAEREKEDQEQAEYYSSDEYYRNNNMTRVGQL